MRSVLKDYLYTFSWESGLVPESHSGLSSKMESKLMQSFRLKSLKAGVMQVMQ